MSNHSYNELKDSFLMYRQDWMPTSLLPLKAGIDPNQKIYSSEKFEQLEFFFRGSILCNDICGRMNCYDVNLNHTHSEPETKEEYQERAIILLEKWKKHNEGVRFTDPEQQSSLERQIDKLSQTISFLKGEKDFEKWLAKFSWYFDNSRISAFSGNQLLIEIERKCKKLLKEEENPKPKKESRGNRGSLIKKLLSSPQVWFWLLVIILLSMITGYFLAKAKKRKRAF